MIQPAMVHMLLQRHSNKLIDLLVLCRKRGVTQWLCRYASGSGLDAAVHMLPADDPQQSKIVRAVIAVCITAGVAASSKVHVYGYGHAWWRIPVRWRSTGKKGCG